MENEEKNEFTESKGQGIVEIIIFAIVLGFTIPAIRHITDIREK